MLGPCNPYMHGNVPRFRPGRIFFILTLHTLRQSLDWPLTWVLTSHPKHETCSSPSKKVHGNVGHFRPGNFFFILTLHTLRQLLDWPLISFLTSQPKHGMCSSPSKKISQNFTSSPITRKSLIAQILERWLLVAKKVPYKFPNNIASKLSTLHAVNWLFVCQPKNAESSRSMQLFFRKFNKITKPHLTYVKFPAYLKYVLEILISCLDLDLDLVSEIFWGCLTFCSFLKLILVRFWCFSTCFEAYDLLYKNLSSNCH